MLPNTPDPARKLQTHYRLSPGLPSVVIAPEIVPVCIVDNLADDPAPNSQPAIGLLDVAASGAGGFSKAAIVTPLDGPNDTYIEGVWISAPGVVCSVRVGGVSGFTEVTANKFWRDFARQGRPNAFIGISNVDVAQSGTALWRGVVGAGEPFFVPLDILLASRGIYSQGIHVSVEVTNTLLRATWLWQEIPRA